MIILSLGENCLPGMMLRRFGVKNTWSTPYTYSRSNICYAIKFEKEGYRDLLNKEFIILDSNSASPNLYRNIKYLDDKDRLLFEKSCSYGFEFTHHDIINSYEALESYKRKIKRMIDLRNSDEQILFLYHHRYVHNDHFQEILQYCNSFAELYNTKQRKCRIVIIKQKLITNHRRRLDITVAGNCIVCDFYTKKVWGGDEAGYISGEIDDDLFVEMFQRLYSMDLLDNIDFIEDYRRSCLVEIEQDIDGLDQLITQGLNMTDGQYLYLWGAGNRGIALLKYLLKRNVKVAAIIDNDTKKQSVYHLPVPVISYAAVTDDKVNIVITVENKAAIEKIKQQILETNRDAQMLTFEDLNFP